MAPDGIDPAHRCILLAGAPDGPASSLGRMLPFVLGTFAALASFAFLAWDLGHHRAPYSPPHSPSRLAHYFQYYWLVDLPIRLFLRLRRKYRTSEKAN